MNRASLRRPLGCHVGEAGTSARREARSATRPPGPVGTLFLHEEEEVKRGYHADIDPAALNRQVEAFVSVQLRPPSRQAIEGFKAAMFALPQVMAVYVVAGEHDFLVHVSVPSLDALHSFLIDRLTQRREVAVFRSQIIYDSARKNTCEPLAPTP